MSLFRAGVLLLPLFISACSLPILHKTTPPQTEKTVQQQPAAKETTSSPAKAADVLVELGNKLDDQVKLAKTQYSELSARSGSAPNVPYTNKESLTTKQEISDSIQKIRSYNSQVSTQLAAIDSRVEQRKKANVPGDIIQILVSKTNVTLPNSSFETQQLIGQWVRGESRVIRLKDSLLFDAQHSEDLRITYSESYQLLVNDKVISIINPNKDKNHASFDVSTTENNGSIVGSLDYRMVSGNR